MLNKLASLGEFVFYLAALIFVVKLAILAGLIHVVE